MIKTRKWNYFHEKAKIKSRLIQTSSGECLGDEKYRLHNDKYTKYSPRKNCVNRA